MAPNHDLAQWLAANPAAFGAVFDAAGLLAGVIEEADDDFCYVAANANVADRYGLPPGTAMRGRTGRSLGSSREAIQRTLAHIDQCHREGPSRSDIRRAVDGRRERYLTVYGPAPSSPTGARREIFLSLDVTALKAAEDEAARQQTLAEVALDAAGMGVWEYDVRADRLSWDYRAARLAGFDGSPVSLRTFMAHVHPGDVERVAATQAASGRAENGGRYDIEHRIVAADGCVRWIETAGRMMFEEGVATRVVGTVRDVSEEVEARERQAVMASELNHRVKNTLSLVLAIIDQAQRTSRSPQRLADRIRNRVRALSKTHELLAAHDWREVDLRGLLVDELIPYGHGETSRIRLSGPAVPLGPKGAVSLSLLFHELATNAARHGALSSETGRLDVEWSVTEGSQGREMRLTWKESGGPQVPEQRLQGFGTRMIERGLIREYPDGVRLLFEPDGVRCEVRLPLRRLTVS